MLGTVRLEGVADANAARNAAGRVDAVVETTELGDGKLDAGSHIFGRDRLRTEVDESLAPLELEPTLGQRPDDEI